MDGEEEQYRKRMRKRLQESMKAAQLEEQKKEIMKQFLDANAYERLMNIRVSNYELYSQLVKLVVSLAQGNRIAGKMTEAQLMDVLRRLTEKEEPKIEFKRK